MAKNKNKLKTIKLKDKEQIAQVKEEVKKGILETEEQEIEKEQEKKQEQKKQEVEKEEKQKIEEEKIKGDEEEQESDNFRVGIEAIEAKREAPVMKPERERTRDDSRARDLERSVQDVQAPREEKKEEGQDVKVYGGAREDGYVKEVSDGYVPRAKEEQREWLEEESARRVQDELVRRPETIKRDVETRDVGLLDDGTRARQFQDVIKYEVKQDERKMTLFEDVTKKYRKRKVA